jgi:hypothetical protein
MVPTPAQHQSVCAFLVGIVHKVTALLAYYLTFLHVAYLGRLRQWNVQSCKLNNLPVLSKLRMIYDRMTFLYQVLYAGFDGGLNL